MEYFFYIIVVVILIDLESKISKIKKDMNQNKKINIKEISNLVGKKVCINIDNENINNSYLFTPSYNTKGIIKEVNNDWLIFVYETKKETIEQYFRLRDIISIDEIQ